MVEELSVRELNERLQRNEIVVLDVREPWEIVIGSLPGSLNIAMGEIPTRLDDLPTDKDIAVFCHHGNRSLQVAEYLRRNGFENVYNVTGGIAAWSQDVDSKVPTY